MAAPRILERYRKEVAPKLKTEFAYKNPHQVPSLTKIVVNIGLGEAVANPKLMEKATEELAAITGHAAWILLPGDLDALRMGAEVE